MDADGSATNCVKCGRADAAFEYLPICWPCWRVAQDESINNVAAAINYITKVYGSDD